MYSPGSEQNSTICPWSTIIMHWPSATTMTEPLVMMLSVPLVLEDRPPVDFRPFIIRTLAGISSHMKNSFHWSASTPVAAPIAACISPIIFPSFQQTAIYGRLFSLIIPQYPGKHSSPSVEKRATPGVILQKKGADGCRLPKGFIQRFPPRLWRTAQHGWTRRVWKKYLRCVF